MAGVLVVAKEAVVEAVVVAIAIAIAIAVRVRVVVVVVAVVVVVVKGPVGRISECLQY